ncbi:MAG: hypothetical protein ACRDRL_06705, partial [Sciscionella sp.]
MPDRVHRASTSVAGRRHPPDGRRRAGLAVASAVLALTTACSTTTAPAPGPHRQLPAAEPANSPPLTVAPAGKVIPIGALPEGVVADAKTHLVAVGVRKPYRLLLLDDRSGKVEHSVPLPGHLRHLQLVARGGPVLVPDENSDMLLTVSLP